MTELQMPRKVLQLNMETQLAMLAEKRYGKGIADCTDEEVYYAVLELTKEMTEVTEEITGEKCGEARGKICRKQFSLGGAIYGQGQSGHFQYVKP